MRRQLMLCLCLAALSCAPAWAAEPEKPTPVQVQEALATRTADLLFFHGHGDGGSELPAPAVVFRLNPSGSAARTVFSSLSSAPLAAADLNPVLQDDSLYTPAALALLLPAAAGAEPLELPLQLSAAPAGRPGVRVHPLPGSISDGVAEEELPLLQIRDGQRALTAPAGFLMEIPQAAAAAGASLRPQVLPQDGAQFNLPALQLRGLLQGLLYTPVDKDGFVEPAGALQGHLYARFARRLVQPGERLADLGAGCSLQEQYNCGLYFVGEEVSAVLDDPGADSAFYIADGLYGIPLQLAASGEVSLRLRSALLSNSAFINYGVPTELELALLQDLGLSLDRRNFYGRSIYRHGSAAARGQITAAFNFSRHESEGDAYVRGAAAQMLAVGLHVYGSYNDVAYQGNINTHGEGAVGVRVDGSAVNFSLPYQSTIRSGGAGGTGLLFAGGSGSRALLSGRISAMGPDGTAVLIAPGSSITADPFPAAGGGTGSAAEPMLQRLDISGTLQGREYALRVAPGGQVREINLLGHARLTGDLEVGALPGQEAAVLQLCADQEALARESGAINQGDPKAHVRIEGAVRGDNLQVVQPGGSSELSGALKASRLSLQQAVMRLNLPAGQIGETGQLSLGRGSVLDLGNDRSDVLKADQVWLGAGSTIRVDTDGEGYIRDRLEFAEIKAAGSGTVTLEPVVSHDELRRLNADPGYFLAFLQNFTVSVNDLLRPHGLQTGYPENIWDSQGNFGREINCSARGCRAGIFVNAQHNTRFAAAEPSRWLLSLSGLVLIAAAAWLYSAAPGLRRCFACRGPQKPSAA